MRRVRGRRAVWLGLVLASGCAAFATRDDYADYRAVRLAPDDEARLFALQRYASRHPDGQWADAVAAERRSRDMATYERGKGDRKGIELYLGAFPDGVFAAQARARLRAIEAIEARTRLEAERASRLAAERRARDAELRRTWVSRFVGYWVRTLLGLNRWGTPIEETARANPAFSRAFAQMPKPRCTSDECVKVYEDRFAVPMPGGTRIERVLRLVLRLELHAGRLVRAELLMPAWGFSRWLEIEERRLLLDAVPAERAQAVARARAHAEPLLVALPGTWEPVAEATLLPPRGPAIAASGELTDTTVEDPGVPSSRIQGDAPGSSPAAAQREGVPPQLPERAPDMVFDPLRVRRDGRLGPVDDRLPSTAAEAPSAGGEETLVFDPMTVSRAGETAAGSAASGATMELSASPRSVVAWTNGTLRVSIFAAGTDEGEPAYDGIVIEHAGAGEGAR